MSSSLWQHPYVNLFKHFNVGQWKKSTKEGDVVTVMDRSLKSTVYKISGAIPAGNYIQMPKTSSQSLGLTGRYLYLMFKAIPTKYFVVHIDVATLDGLVVRVSFSNLFKEFKSTSTWLQFPFVCHAAKGSVHAATSVGSTEHAGPAPMSSRWTLLSLDLPYILAMYLNRKYSYIKTLRLCANMLVKNVCTSDLVFEPGMTVDEVKKTGLAQTGVAPLPREMAYPLCKGEDWNDFYDIIRFPSDGSKKPFDSVQHSKRSPRRVRIGGRSPVRDDHSAGPRPPSPRRCSPRQVTVSRRSRDPQSAIDTLTSPKKSLRRVPVQELPSIVIDIGDTTRRTVNENGGGVHIYAHPDDEIVVCRESQKKNVTTSPKTLDNPPPKRTVYSTLQPDPILKLRRIVGFGGVNHSQALWTRDNQFIVYPSYAVVVALEVATGGQQFFVGHTDRVSCISLTGYSTLLASGQTGQQSIVRIWSVRTRHCLAMFKTHVHSLHCLSFSDTGSTLCGLGRDGHGKHMVVVWNTSRAEQGGEVTVLAKAHTDVDMVRMRVSSFDDLRMVSCGRDNVRLWRVRDGALRSAPVKLGEYHLMEFTDCCYKPRATPADVNSIIYACSRSGHVFEIDYQKLSIDNVRRLLPVAKKRQEKQTFNSGAGLAINSISVSDSFCVTGTDDGYLRLWPLDFSQVYLEAEHDGPVTVVQMSSDGLSILAGTATGYVGTLDVATRNYTTLLRSHTDRVLSAAIDPLRRHLATVSLDNTIRVWDLDTLQQLYDFTSPRECPCTVCYHPTQQTLACGFQTGTVRVFNVASTSMIAEFQQHRGSITGIGYSPNGDHLYSADSTGGLALYETDVGNVGHYAVARVLGDVVARGEKFAPSSLAISADGFHVAFVGPSEFTVTVVNARSLDEVLRIDISTLPGDTSLDTAVRVCYAPVNLRQLLVVTSSNRLLKLNSSTGRLLTEVGNVHRRTCSSLSVSTDGKYLATGGDRVVKIWNYSMRLDLNFQVFIGHSDEVTNVLFAPDGLGLVSTGEAIMVWDFLANPRLAPIDNQCTEGRVSGRDYNTSNRTSPQHTILLTSTSRPRDLPPPLPSVQHALPHVADISTIDQFSSIHDDDNDTEVALYNSQVTADDDDADDIITIQQSGGDVIVTANGRPVSNGVVSSVGDDDDDVTIINPAAVLTNVDVTPAASEGLVWTVEKRRRATLSPVKCHAPDVQDDVTSRTHHARPDVQKHFIRRVKTGNLAQRYYIAPAEQAGLKLKAVIGYNGNGRDNVVWHADTGFFAYSCGALVVVEDLSAGTQTILQGHVEEISCLALQHDGEMLASASGAQDHVASQIILWDVGSCRNKRVLNYHQYDIVCLAYSRDDRLLISMGDYRECALVVWSTYTCSVLTSTKVAAPVHDVTWDPCTSNEFVTAGADGSLTFWLLDESGAQMTLKRHVADTPDEVLKTKKFQQSAEFTCVTYGAQQILYVATDDGKVSAWDVSDNTCFMHWQAERTEIEHMVCRRDRMVTSSAAGALRLWSLKGVGEIKAAKKPRATGGGLTMEDEMMLDGCITSVMFDEAMELGIVGTTAGTLWYINWTDRTSIRLVSGHESKINGVCMSENSYLATCSDDGSLRLWLADGREQSLQFLVQDQACTCVAFAPSSRDQACKPVTSSRTVQFGASPVRLHHKAALTLPRLVAGYSDGTVRVYDANRVEMVLKMHPHAVAVTAVCYTSHGRMILSGASDGTLAVSSASTGVTVRIITDHRSAAITTIDTATCLDDGGCPDVPETWLAASADSRVSVWSSDWSRDHCQLADWLTFPAPAYTPGGAIITDKNKWASYDIPPSLAKFSLEDKDTIVFAGYGLEKTIQFYSMSLKKVVRTCPITDWAASMDLSPRSGIVALGSNDRLVKLMDYYEGTFQDYIGHHDGVHLVKFSPDGAHLFTVAHNEILVWRVTV